jgi:hypothetical protein
MCQNTADGTLNEYYDGKDSTSSFDNFPDAERKGEEDTSKKSVSCRSWQYNETNYAKAYQDGRMRVNR